jgi:hypothetical protein
MGVCRIRMRVIRATRLSMQALKAEKTGPSLFEGGTGNPITGQFGAKSKLDIFVCYCNNET